MNVISAPMTYDRDLELSAYLRSMTEEEFYEFCQTNPLFKFERDADGTIHFMALTGGNIGRRNTKLISRLDSWADENGTGIVFDSSTGFRLPTGAVRSPDAAWVRRESWEALTEEQRDKFPPVCPDFVVELMSESDQLKGMVAKMQEFLENGCRLAWLLIPKQNEVRIFRADGSVSVVRDFEQSLTGEDVLPGFTFDLRLLL